MSLSHLDLMQEFLNIRNESDPSLSAHKKRFTQQFEN